MGNRMGLFVWKILEDFWAESNGLLMGVILWVNLV
jgi:hypothetical protein